MSDDAASDEQLVHTISLRTTPERLWQALTDPVQTVRWWGVEFETDWSTGSPMVWRERGVETADPEQVVLEVERPRRLSYTWHTFTPDWAQRAGVDADTLATIRTESRSRVAFVLDPDPGSAVVELTVVHTFPSDSTVIEMCRRAWPVLLSELAALVEDPVPAT